MATRPRSYETILIRCCRIDWPLSGARAAGSENIEYDGCCCSTPRCIVSFETIHWSLSEHFNGSAVNVL
jgi:hypothetical protein